MSFSPRPWRDYDHAPFAGLPEESWSEDLYLDNELIERAASALETGAKVRFATAVTNVDRTVGTMLGNAVTKATKGKGLPRFTPRGCPQAACQRHWCPSGP